MKNLWRWLSNEKNRSTLGFIGAAIGAVVAAGWAVFTFFYSPEIPVPHKNGAERQKVEKLLRHTLAKHLETSQVICTALGILNPNSEWKSSRSYLISVVESYVVPDSLNRTINNALSMENITIENFNRLDSISKNIRSFNDFRSIKNTKEAVLVLRKLDKNFQAASEVILFELGENMIDHGTFSHRLRSLMATKDNNYYCIETGYQTPTKQKLYSR